MAESGFRPRLTESSRLPFYHSHVCEVKLGEDATKLYENQEAQLFYKGLWDQLLMCRPVKWFHAMGLFLQHIYRKCVFFPKTNFTG